MKHANVYRLRLAAIATSVGLALGGAAFAQQGQPQGGADQSNPSRRSEPQSLDQSTIHPQDRSSSLSRNEAKESDQGAQELDKLSEQHSNLSTFVKAVQKAGMEDSLTSGRNYTVFAPNDSAFQAMTGKSTDELMKPENREELISLLRAHIVADDVTPDKVKQLGAAETIDGGTVNIDERNGNVMVGDAKVTDDQGIQVTDNLRIYPIDHVLAANPPSGSAARTSGG
jgi:uncharacterized surface protein with fasciclin (FAS1) repeats